MSGFIEIQCEDWVAASPELVRLRYTDLHHRIKARVNPRERLRLLPPSPDGPRYERLSRGLVHTERDLFQRQYPTEDSVVDVCIAGSNWGRMVSMHFCRRHEAGRNGTLVKITMTQPLSPSVGRLLGQWMKSRIRRELHRLVSENKAELERRYHAPTDWLTPA